MRTTKRNTNKQQLILNKKKHTHTQNKITRENFVEKQKERKI